MCTVSYLPLQDKSFLLTSNRDEAPGRNAEEWSEVVANTSERIYFPKDPKSGGTWICVSDGGRIVCLLNGAYEPFEPSPRYQLSRGQIVLDFFNFESYAKWEYQVDLTMVAPFTLVVFDGQRLFELVWDGQLRYVKSLDENQRHFWSSVTLYPPEVRSWRKKLFFEWSNQNQSWTQNEIIEFHCIGGQGDGENDFIMNRNEIVKTLSVTSVQLHTENIHLEHLNLESDAHIKRNLHLHSINS